MQLLREKAAVMWKKRLIYLLMFLAIVCAEAAIALFVKDQWLRPYGGDVLAAAGLYCLLRVFISKRYKWFPLCIFLMTVAVEVLQLIDILSLLSWENSFLRILLGGTFDMKDIICYGIGCGIAWLIESGIYSAKHG